MEANDSGQYLASLTLLEKKASSEYGVKDAHLVEGKMPKGLRLSFNGITCTVREIKIIAHSLGYDTSPVFGGWGKNGGYRNFFGTTVNERDNAACESLVNKGMMTSEPAGKWSVCETVYHVTKAGIKWFSLFRRNHPHADFK